MGDVGRLGVVGAIAASVDEGMDVLSRQVNTQSVPRVAVIKHHGLGELVAGVGVGVGLVGTQTPQVDVGHGLVVAGQHVERVVVGQYISHYIEAHIGGVKSKGDGTRIDGDAIGAIIAVGHLGAVPVAVGGDGLVVAAGGTDAIVAVELCPIVALAIGEHKVIHATLINVGGVSVESR